MIKYNTCVVCEHPHVPAQHGSATGFKDIPLNDLAGVFPALHDEPCRVCECHQQWIGYDKGTVELYKGMGLWPGYEIEGLELR